MSKMWAGLMGLMVAGTQVPAHAAGVFYADTAIQNTLTCSGGVMTARVRVTNGGNSARDTRFAAHLPVIATSHASITSVTCTTGICQGLPSSPETNFCRLELANTNQVYVTCGDRDHTTGNNYDMALNSSTTLDVIITITDAYDFDSTGYYKMDGNAFSASPDYAPSNNYDFEQLVVGTTGCPI